MHDAVASMRETVLRELNRKMAEECQCTLRKSATQAVPGDGSVLAEILFVGEAPGKNEDLQGTPFVGAAGKFLEEMFRSIGLSREDVYITNIVKYRPPDNRDPHPEEIADCVPWLREQIILIDPVVIVTLGRHAMNHFFPGMKISEAHGRPFRKAFPDIGTRVFVPLYHPAAALYNGNMRETLKSDFLRVPKVLETTKRNQKNPKERFPETYPR